MRALPWSIVLAARTASLWVLLGCLFVYIPSVSPMVNTDVAASSLTAWRISQTGHPWMEGLDLREAGDIGHYIPSRNGHVVPTATPGQIWLAVPAYFGSSTDQSDVSYVQSGLMAALATAAAMTLLFLALRAHLSLRRSLLTTSVVAFATPIWTVSADAVWTHPVTVLGLTGAAWALSRSRYNAAGFMFAVAITARPHIAVIAAVVGLGLAFAQRRPGIAVRIGVCSATGMVAMALWTRWVHGVWDLRSGYGHAYSTTVSGMASEGFLVNVLGFLVSPDRGFFVWTPLALVMSACVVRCRANLPSWSRWLALGGIAYSAIQISVGGFAGGDGFYGYRHGLELLVCLAPAYAFASPHLLRRESIAAIATVVIQFAAMLTGAFIGARRDLYVLDTHVWDDNNLLHLFAIEPGAAATLFGAGLMTAGCAAAFAWRLRSRARDTAMPEPAHALAAQSCE